MAPQAFASDPNQTNLAIPASNVQEFQPQAVPEPASLVLLGIGLMGGALAGRRRYSKR